MNNGRIESKLSAGVMLIITGDEKLILENGG
jgi:hypothetical protein